MKLFAEMTRDEIRAEAPESLAIIPTASTEQHGPHMAVITDTLLVEAVSRRAAEVATDAATIITPTVTVGSSHHHRPHGGVLSLPSDIYQSVVSEVIRSLVGTGFRRILVLNGHGGNTHANVVTGLDAVNRHGLDATVAAAAYWDVARAALVEDGLASGLIPGHAGHFETSMVLAIRPDLVRAEVLAGLPPVDPDSIGLFRPLPGTVVQTAGLWERSPGFTDDPASATAEAGHRYLETCAREVGGLYRDLASG